MNMIFVGEIYLVPGKFQTSHFSKTNSVTLLKRKKIEIIRAILSF